MNFTSNCIQLKDGKLSAVYKRNNNIYERVYLPENNKWADAALVAADAAAPAQSQQQTLDGVKLRRVPVADKHFLEIYQQQGKIMYREFYDENIGGFNAFHTHSTIARYGSGSFLATTHALHGAFVLRGVFGSRLIYRRVDDDGFREVTVLDNSRQTLYNVVLCLTDGVLRLSFMAGDVLYTCKLAEYDVLLFSPLVVYADFRERGVVVAKTDFFGGNDSFLANELLITDPWEIVIHKNFVFGLISNNASESAVPVAMKPINAEECDYNSFFDNMENEFAPDETL